MDKRTALRKRVAWLGSCTYTIINKTFENFRHGALITLKDFVILITNEKAGKRTSKITTHRNTTFLDIEEPLKDEKFFGKTGSAGRIIVSAGGTSGSGL